MDKHQRRPILGNGEHYIEPYKKSQIGRPPEPPRTYHDAKENIRTGLLSALEKFSSAPPATKLNNEAVFCLRLHPDSIAKSYDPNAFFSNAPQIRKIGSRYYHVSPKDVAQTKRIRKKVEEGEESVQGRLIFIQSSVNGFEQLLEQLDRPAELVPKTVQDEIRRVERFDQLTPNERVLGFSETWETGRVELVFHPSHTAPDKYSDFIMFLFDYAGIKQNQCTIREYTNGPTFVSCLLELSTLDNLRNVNPLRSIHPLIFEGLENLRGSKSIPAPNPPTSTSKSAIKVGMFDGGIDCSLPHLIGHAEEDTSLSIQTPPDPDCVAHGTAVTGALLYGELNSYEKDATLPQPPVSVVSFRTLPTSSADDFDLYESIDVIENAVPTRKDIKVYNLSFGPRGPITDDTISRFTYALDLLAVAHKVLFIIAVGNDGESQEYDRIQSPSDAVHGIGVGAYSRAFAPPKRASYSCKGPGRECGKIKPDVLAYGGCSIQPFHLLSLNRNEIILNWGTSFAAPLVSRICAFTSEAFDRSSPLLTKGLIVHNASIPEAQMTNEIGHGIITPNIDTILNCDHNEVTVVYQGDIAPKRCVRLPIPWPNNSQAKHLAQIKWTVVGLPPVDPNHPSDYTSGCLEDTFYPNEHKYTYSSPDKKKHKVKVLHAIKDQTEIDELLKQGWKKSLSPHSDSGNKYKNEFDRRINCKWEPIVRREIRKKAENLCNPFLTLQAIGRNSVPDRFDYAVVVTVSFPKYPSDLYTDIRSQFPALTPIRLRAENEIRIQL